MAKKTKFMQDGIQHLIETSFSQVHRDSDWANLNAVLALYQTITDNGLLTTSKEIVGAINEIKAELAMVETEIPQDIIHGNNILQIQLVDGENKVDNSLYAVTLDVKTGGIKAVLK